MEDKKKAEEIAKNRILENQKERRTDLIRASVPKEISLFPAPVITRDPVPQSEDELSAKASVVNDSGTVKVKVPLPIAIVPVDD